MMPAADIVGNLDHRLILIHLHTLQHGSSDEGMGLHNLKFFFRQAARLVQNLFVDADLADIVKG